MPSRTSNPGPTGFLVRTTSDCGDDAVGTAWAASPRLSDLATVTAARLLGPQQTKPATRDRGVAGSFHASRDRLTVTRWRCLKNTGPSSLIGRARSVADR